MAGSPAGRGAGARPKTQHVPRARAAPTRAAGRGTAPGFLGLPLVEARAAAGTKVHIVGFGVFDVQETAATKHPGRLMAGIFIVSGTGTPTWIPGSSFDVATLKLVN